MTPNALKCREMGTSTSTAQWQSHIITYTKPGPLPLVPPPLHLGQQVGLKGRQELLHHQLTQDLQGKGEESRRMKAS